MRCPYCSTENRDDREKCYHCGKDLSMLRLIVNRARNHYNTALEHAERGRLYEAAGELRSALQLDSHLVDARLLLGTIYARMGRPAEAREQWEKVLAEQPNSRRAHDYIRELPALESRLPLLTRLNWVLAGFAALVLVLLLFSFSVAWPSREQRLVDRAWEEFAERDLAGSLLTLASLSRPVRNTRLEARASSLEESVERVIADRLALIQDLSAQSDVRGALNQVRLMRVWDLPPTADEALRQQERLLRRVVEERLNAIAQLDFTPENERLLRDQIGDAQLFFPGADFVDGLVDSFRSRGQGQLHDLLRELDARLLDNAQVEEAQLLLDRAERLGRALDTTEPVRVRRMEWQRVMLERAIQRAGQLVELDRLEEAVLTLESSPLEGPDELVARRREMLRTVGPRWATEEFGAWLADRDAALDHEGLRWVSHLVASDRARFDAERERRRDRDAAWRIYALLDRAADLEQHPPSPAEALWLSEEIDAVRALGVPSRLGARVDETLFFIEVLARGVLGDERGSDAALELMRSRHPRSPYLRRFESGDVVNRSH